MEEKLSIEGRHSKGQKEILLEESLVKKYIPMTETTYYTLLAVTSPRHGYAIMQFVSELTKGRIQLGTGTLYTMVGRLVADHVIRIADNQDGKKSYQITQEGLELLLQETRRLGKQLEDGKVILEDGNTIQVVQEPTPEDRGCQNG